MVPRIDLFASAMGATKEFKPSIAGQAILFASMAEEGPGNGPVPGTPKTSVACATTETYQKHPENPQDWTNINIGVQ